MTRGGNTKSCLKGIGQWGVGCGEKGALELRSGEQGETIDNLRVNHTIKNGFGVRERFSSLIKMKYCKVSIQI